jgi:hypothetical protein
MIALPIGTTDADKNWALFDPTKIVRPCYWGVEGFGWALGFTQTHETDRLSNHIFLGAYFKPRISPVEWTGGNVMFGDKTRDRFIKAFRLTYGVNPVLEQF